MNKIGLTVCYDTKNFGSQLQVLATINKIEDLGYNTEIIRYKKKITPIFIYQTIPRFFNPYFVRSKLSGFKVKRFLHNHPDIKDKINIRNRKFEIFVKENFKNLSNYYEGWEKLKKHSNKNYDTFLCGSDQLWLPSNLGSHFYTLEFAKPNKKKISYATSFGVSHIPFFQKIHTKKYLSKFDFLSCREEKGAQIIKDIANKEATVVCDPTLLLTSKEWNKIIPTKEIIKEKYILCYFLGDNIEHRKIAKKIKKKTNLKIVSIPFLDCFIEEDIKFGDYQMFDIDAKDFVNLIRNAQYILTDSFHGSVFSILNHKQFIIFNRFSNDSKNSRNSRIDSLLSRLDLKNRRYYDNENILFEEIIYNNVETKLQNIRKESLDFLKKALAYDKTIR